MRRYEKLMIFLLLCGGLTSCQQEELRELSQPDAVIEAPAGQEIRKGVLQIKFTPEVARKPQMQTRAAGMAVTGNPEIDSILMTLGEVRMERIFPYAGKFEERHRAAGLDRWYRLVFDEDIDPLELQKITACLQGVEAADPEYVISLSEQRSFVKDYVHDLMDIPGVKAANAMPFNDPQLSMQWHYDHGSLPMVDGAGIGLFLGWRASVGDPRVIVAVLDMGVDYTHEDLKANMWVNEKELNGQPGVDDDGNGYKDDIYGYDFEHQRGDYVIGDHGTHVAGTVAAVNNNGVGVCGVAGGSGIGDGVRIMSCCLGNGKSFKNPEQAMVYAADNGALIIQCSWVVPHTVALQEAVKYFVNHAGNELMQGGLAVFAAGNDGITTKQYPAGYDNTVAVASVNQSNRRSSFSNYGDWIDISAPGGAGSTGGSEVYGILSTLPGNTYGYFSGTSMAAPHVSGVAALIISAKGGPDFTADQLKDILYRSVEPLSEDEPNADKMGRGLLRADKALWEDDNVAPEAVTDLMSVKEKGTGMLLWHIAKDEHDGQPLEYVVFYNKTSPANGSGCHTVVYSIRGKKAGEGMACPWPDFPENGSWYIAVAGRDPWENQSDLSNEIVVEWQDDHQAPAVVSEFKFVQENDGLYLSWTNPVDTQDGTAAFYRLTVTRTVNSTEEAVLDTVVVCAGKAGEQTMFPIHIPGLDETYIFRIAAVDAWNNSSKFSEGIYYLPVGVNELKCFPNPVKQDLHLKWGSGLSGVKTVRVYDLSGRQVWTTTLPGGDGAGQTVLDLSVLNAGPYILKFSSDKGTEVRNLIKIK